MLSLLLLFLLTNSNSSSSGTTTSAMQRLRPQTSHNKNPFTPLSNKLPECQMYIHECSVMPLCAIGRDRNGVPAHPLFHFVTHNDSSTLYVYENITMLCNHNDMANEVLRRRQLQYIGEFSRSLVMDSSQPTLYQQACLFVVPFNSQSGYTSTIVSVFIV